MNLIGVDIGGTKTAVSIGTDEPKILQKEAFATSSPQETIEKIIKFCKQFKNSHPVSALGISCGGPLSAYGGVILNPPNLLGWRDIPICQILHDCLSLPVSLQNDANAGVVAEHLWGAGKGFKNIIFLTFGTGLGAGLILNGLLYSGTSDMAGEVGHIRLESQGPIGYGKSGSFEGFCSGGGLSQLAQLRIKENPNFAQDFINFLEGRPINAHDLSIAAKNNDPFALSIFEESGCYLGKGLAILLDMLNPERIIIGSMFVRMEQYFRPSMERVLREESLIFAQEVCKIVPAQLGESLGDYAALGIALLKQKEVTFV
ncbi:MAG: ROK family protein [Brevinema sp.]